MSEMFAVRVLDVSKQVVRLKVTSVHPDSAPPAPRAVFALMLMYDPISESDSRAFAKHRHLEGSPLARAMDQRDYLDGTWLKENAQAFVAKATVSGSVLEIQPTHPAWIEHLRKGMAWETAAYDGGPGLPAPPRAPAPVTTAVRSQDPAAGFRVGRPKHKEYDIEGAHIPLHGANRYVADPVITDLAAMNKATKTMLGQPLLLVPRRGPARVGTLVSRRTNGVSLYYEMDFGYGGNSIDLTEVTSLGRAWLTQEAATRKPAAKKTAKRTPAPATAAKKTAKTSGARTTKKAAKATGAAATKKTAKKAARATGAAATKKTAKKATRAPTRKATKAAPTTRRASPCG